MPNFEVLEATRANEAEDPLKAEIADLRRDLEALAGDRRPRKRGAPKRINDAVLVQMNHLHLHAVYSWSYADLAVEFYDNPRSANPAEAVRKQLRRFRVAEPRLASEAGCPRCRAGDLGYPPG